MNYLTFLINYPINYLFGIVYDNILAKKQLFVCKISGPSFLIQAS